MRAISALPDVWRFVEKHVPGAYAAWERDVGDPVMDGELGISGKPWEVSYHEERCWWSRCYICTRCRRYRGGMWIKITHRPWPVPAPTRGEPPTVDEHW